MRITRSDRFKKAYNNLTEEDKRRAEKALHLLVANLSHPSLRVKKIRKTQRIWEARVSKEMRMTFELQDDLLLLRNIGKHDKIIDSP